MANTYFAHKDRLFRKLFGDETNREALLSLYNALNHTAYTDPSELTINTIEDVLYMSMKNDVSCILDDQMVLMEHQSTFNPNMPLRGLIYFGKLYNQYIESNRLDLYKSKQIIIPTPRYFILYNGTKEVADKVSLHLSDAFAKKDQSGNFEWTAEMININHGHNEEIMRSCRVLREYAYFVQLIRDKRGDGLDIEAAVNHAVDQCIEEDVLQPFLLKWKSEVIDMCITEYNEAATMQAIKEEGIEEGIGLGIGLGELRLAFKQVNLGILSPEIASALIDLSTEDFLKLLEVYNQNPKNFLLEQ